MTTKKEEVLQAVQTLPDDASVEDVTERLFLLAKIERGIQQADAGELIPRETVKERMATHPGTNRLSGHSECRFCLYSPSVAVRGGSLRLNTR